MATSTKWQLARQDAERYEQILVPAIFGPAARALVDWSALKSDETVLDIGSGTGAATRFAAEKVGVSGRVVGIDSNPAMVEVAKSMSVNQGALIEWHEVSAYALPLSDQTVDAVLCAQTLQFLKDRGMALSEIYRVLKPGGRVVMSLWSNIEENPYFHILADAVSKHVSEEAAAGLQEETFSLSNADEIRALLESAGFTNIEMNVKQLELELPKLTDFVPLYISATPMAAGFNSAEQAAQQAVIQEVSAQLALYESNDSIRIPFRVNLAKAVR
jgi:ubiquinone/menaquinone biosynthesis C-methylase UbiE